MAARPLQAALAWSALALVLVCVLWFAVPVRDIDFWWHLSAGEYVVVAGEIPEHDPFGIFAEINRQGQTILRGQWLGQVAIYLAYRAGGLDGVILLRALLLVAVVAWVARRTHDECNRAWLVLLTLVPLIGVLGAHVAERPQLFSFMFFALLSQAIGATSMPPKDGRLPLWLPPVFVLWANIHPGAMLGAAILVLHTASRGAAAWYRHGRAAASRLRRDIATTAGALAGTVATPIGLTAYDYQIWLQSNPIRDRISEYASPIAFISTPSMTIDKWCVLLAAALAVPLAAWLWRRRREADAAATVALLVLALSANRYAPFFVIFVIPLIAAGAGHLLAKPRGLSALLEGSGTPAATIACTALLAVGLAGPRETGSLAPNRFPEAAVERLRLANARGRIFNTINWGGYINWQLKPRARPFIDGRYLMNTGQTIIYTHILWATPPGLRAFEELRFDFVLLPWKNPFDSTSEEYPIIAYVARNPAWRELYRDNGGVLFERRTAADRAGAGVGAD